MTHFRDQSRLFLMKSLSYINFLVMCPLDRSRTDEIELLFSDIRSTDIEVLELDLEFTNEIPISSEICNDPWD